MERKAFPRTFGLFLAVLACGVWLEAVAAGHQPQAKGPMVDLDHSFQIPQKDGHRLSHAPAMVFTSDGKRMVMATADKEIVVFDAATRKLLRRHRLAEKATDAVSIDRAGRLAAWVLQNGGIVVVDVGSGQIVARDEKAKAKWIAIDPTGQRLAISRGAVLELRRVNDLSVLHRLNGHKKAITNVAWSRDGARVAATAADGRLAVYAAATGRTLYQTKKSAALYALDFHPTRNAIAFGGHDRKIYQVDLTSGKEQVLSGRQPFWITCLGYSPDGAMIAVGDESCDVWLYDVARPGRQVFHSKHHVECWLSQVAWTPDNETFLFGCRPNSHAGRPALYRPLARAEANRRAEVRQTRQQALDAIETELKTARDQTARANLERLRVALNNEEQLAAHDALQGNVAVQVQQGGQGGGAAINTSVLSKKLQAVLAAHRTTQRQAEEKLNRKFNVNQWRVRRE